MLPNEPLRKYLFTVLGAIVAVLVAYGFIDSEQAPLWIALGAAVLGVAGTEAARRQVTPVDKVADHDGLDGLDDDDLLPVGDEPVTLNEDLVEDSPGTDRDLAADEGDTLDDGNLKPRGDGV